MSSSIYRSTAGAHAIERRYAELLEAWPVPSERLRVLTSQGETFVLAFGPADAPPVLALHGSGANAAAWLAYSAQWSRHLRVYAVDVIGEPGRSAPARPPLGTAAYARWLDDVLDGLSLDTAALVGMSLGGLLATDYATTHPDRINRLALLVPAGIGRQRLGVVGKLAFYSLFGLRGQRQALRAASGPVARGAGTDSAELEFATLIFRHFKPRTRLPVFSDDTLRQLCMPVLAILGEQDTLFDAHDTRRRLTETVPHATVQLLADAGHLLPDQSGPVADFILRLDGAPGSAR